MSQAQHTRTLAFVNPHLLARLGMRCISSNRSSLAPGCSSGPGMNSVICGPVSGQYQPRLKPFTQATPCNAKRRVFEAADADCTTGTGGLLGTSALHMGAAGAVQAKLGA